MASDVVHHLATAGGVADVHGVLELEMGGQRRQIVGVVIHVVPDAALARAAMATAVMGDDAEAVVQEEQHLRVPVVGRKRPAMTEDNGLTRTPVLVKYLGAVLGGDRGHDLRSSAAMKGEGRNHFGARGNSHLSCRCLCR